MTRAASTAALPSRFWQTIRRLAGYFPVLLAVGLMLPRLLAPGFGLFDDGRILVTAKTITSGTWYTGADSLEGRFRPVHWLWFTLSYLVGGGNPLWFFIANTAALVLVVAGLIYLVRAVSGSQHQGWIAGLVFVLAGPVAESFLTLKGEVILLTLIVLSLVAVLLYPKAGNLAQKAGTVALTTLSLILAYLTKETTLVLLPVSLVWFLLARFWPGYEQEPRRIAARGSYLVANLIAAAVFFGLRTAALSAQVSAGTYSGQYTFQLSQLGLSALRWAGWLTRDFLWVVPLAGMAILLILLRRRLDGNSLLIDAFVWMGAWVCIYLPWTYMAEYYMLPFALGLAVFVSACLAELVRAWHRRNWERWASLACSAASLVLFTGTLSNDLTNARLQLAVDSANARMMDYLIQKAAPGSTLLVNIQAPNEYVAEMQTQLNRVDGRPDLKIVAFQTGQDLGGMAGPVYIVSPSLENQPLLPVRMGVIEDTQNHWNHTLQDALLSRPASQIVFQSTVSFGLSDVNYPLVFCPLTKTRSFCAKSVPFFDHRLFEYGWTIYELSIR